MSAIQVLIVGAGPTGLNLALRLARHGISFHIIDKNSGPGQASRAMVVHARTLEFYQQLGFADEVVARGVPIQAVHMREGGEEVASVSFQNIGADLSPFPFALSFAQDDHERFLVEKLQAAGVEIEWSVELKEFTQDEDGVRAILEHDGTEETCKVAYLCGCDGAHSRVRHGLPLEFPGGDYQQTFYVADVKIANQNTTDLFINLETTGFVLMLPVRTHETQRLIGILPQPLQNHAEITFEDVQPFAETMLGIRIESVNWFSTYRVHHRVASHFRVGRIFLAGDACHIHSPAGGQGMNTGIGDAVNLSWKLANVLNGQASPALLDTYEIERQAFAHWLVNTTDKAFRGMVNQSAGGQFLRTWLLPHLMPFFTGFSAVRHLIFNTISQTRINYHQSTLSQGHVGHIQSGDRLPWVNSPEVDNFASLRALKWQIHVYGEVTPELRDAANELGFEVESFNWCQTVEAAGFERDALYFIRPDGYIALAASTQDISTLKAFAAKFELQPQS